MVVCGGILLSAIAFLLIQYKLLSHKSSEFEWVAHERFSALKQGIENGLNAAKTIRDLYLVVDDITQGDFRVFSRSIIARHHGIQALKWVPRVP
jgi:CHASE1-domain containing sensor protein